MRHWLVLAAVYAVVAALVLPGSLLASEDQPAPTASAEETGDPLSGEDEAGATPGGEGVADEAPATEAPATEAEPPAETTTAPETTPAAPAPPPPAAETAPAQPAPAETAAAETESADTESAEDSRRKAPAKRKSKRAKASATSNVTISDYRFTPATVTVVEGDTVTWTNDGPSSHSATASNGEFDTGIFPKGESRSATFDTAGTFAYICTPHPNMEGTVVVEAAGSDPSGEEDAAQLENDELTTDENLNADIDNGGLPNTGKDVRAMIILGLAMLAFGSVLSLRARRQS